jgi:hypothetical protein
MGDWTSRDLVTEAVEPTGTDFDGKWEGFMGGYGTASIDGTTKKVGSYSIKFVYDNDWIDSMYDFDSSKNLSQYAFVEFWIKYEEWNEFKSGSDKAQFGLGGMDGYRWWYIRDFIVSGDWIFIRLDLSEYDESQPDFDITDVDSVMFYGDYTSSKTHTIHIDGLIFYKGIKWTGGGADELWATSGNWEGSEIPNIIGEAALFSNSYSSKSCTIQSGDTPPGMIDIESDYTGIISIAPSWFATDMDLYIAASTYGSTNPVYCRNLRVTGGYFPNNVYANGFKVYISGSGVILDGNLCFEGNGDVDLECYQTGMLPSSPRIDGLDFRKNGNVNLLTDAYSDKDISLGYGGVTSVINVGSHELFCKEEIDSPSGQIVNYTITFASGGMLWVGGGGGDFAENFYAADGSHITIGVSGGVPWNYKSGAVTPNVAYFGYYDRATYLDFFGPSEGGLLDFDKKIMGCSYIGKFTAYDGEMKGYGLYSDIGVDLDLDSCSLEITGKMAGFGGTLPGVEDHSILSKGTFDAGVASSLLISSQEDNVIQGVTVFNPEIDSGGVGIDVTASGCIIKGEINEGIGDHLILGSGSYWQEAKVKWLGTGGNDYWGTVGNWQGSHVPQVGDTAWFKGAAVRKCRINAVTPVPAEILVEADYTGSLAEINNNVSSWGSPNLKLTVYGSRNDNFKLGNGYSNWKYLGDVHFERGYLGYNQRVGIYGNLYFSGNNAARIVAMGTNDRIWEFHTQYPYGITPENHITDLYFFNLDCEVVVKGELYIDEWLSYGVDNSAEWGYNPTGHSKTVTYYNDTILYSGLHTMDDMAWFGLLSQLDIKMSPGVIVQHLYTENSNKSYPGYIMVGDQDYLNIGASGTGLWDFDGYFTGEWSYGGYAHRQYFGYCVGCMNRWHHKPSGSYVNFYGMAPGHHFRAYDTGIHIEKYGRWLSYGGDVQAEFFEIDENGYFDQSNSKLIITGKSKIVITDVFPYAPGEPYDDCLWAVWSKGTWVWTPGASVEIRSDVDVRVLGAELPNLLIDSGGIGITVTANG